MKKSDLVEITYMVDGKKETRTVTSKVHMTLKSQSQLHNMPTKMFIALIRYAKQKGLKDFIPDQIVYKFLVNSLWKEYGNG